MLPYLLRISINKPFFPRSLSCSRLCVTKARSPHTVEVNDARNSISNDQYQGKQT